MGAARSARALFLGRGARGRPLRPQGGRRQRAPRFLAAVPADSRRVRLGAGLDGRRILLRVSRLGSSEPPGRSPDGSPRTTGRDRSWRGPHGRWADAGAARAPAVASLRHARHTRRRRGQLSWIYRSVALPPELVRAPTGFGDEPRLLRRRRGLDRPAALAADPHRSYRLARRLLGAGLPGAGNICAAQSLAEAPALGPRAPSPRWPL